MRTSRFASRVIVWAIIVAWFCPGLGVPPRAEARGAPTSLAVPNAAAPSAARSGGQPGTAGEAARFAERERQDGSLATFEAGSRISTTTIIIILLLVIIVLILL